MVWGSSRATSCTQWGFSRQKKKQRLRHRQHRHRAHCSPLRQSPLALHHPPNAPPPPPSLKDTHHQTHQLKIINAGLTRLPMVRLHHCGKRCQWCWVCAAKTTKTSRHTAVVVDFFFQLEHYTTFSFSFFFTDLLLWWNCFNIMYYKYTPHQDSYKIK